MDPVVKPWESAYATFANNPITLIDPQGLDTLLNNPVGENFYLPDGTSNINYFSSEKATGRISGNEYSVLSGSVKNFTINEKTFNASFDIESGNFIGYKTSEGEICNPDNYLPTFVKNIALNNKSLPDLISFSINLESAFIASFNIEWQINRLDNGEKISWFYTRNEAQGWGFGVDWGINVTELNYTGTKPLNMVTSDDVLGDFTYSQINLLYGKGNYKGYDPQGNLIWNGYTTGFGFGFGGSKGKGTTYR